MNLQKDIADAVRTGQSSIEKIMQTELENITIKSPSIWQMYTVRRENEVLAALGKNGVMSAIKDTVVGKFKVHSCRAYMSTEEDMNIYVPKWSLEMQLMYWIDKNLYHAVVNHTVYHEVVHLAHKRKIGLNLFNVWPEEDKENIADHVALQVMSQSDLNNLYPALKSRMQKRSRSLFPPNNKYRNNVAKYIKENAAELREDAKNYEQLKSIKF